MHVVNLEIKDTIETAVVGAKVALQLSLLVRHYRRGCGARCFAASCLTFLSFFFPILCASTHVVAVPYQCAALGAERLVTDMDKILEKIRPQCPTSDPQYFLHFL